MKNTIILALLILSSLGLRGQTHKDSITMTKPDSTLINGKLYPCRCFHIITVPSDSVRYFEARGWVSDRVKFQQLKPVKP